jgi:hypothetical protein
MSEMKSKDEALSEDLLEQALTPEQLQQVTGGRITNLRANASAFAGQAGSFQGQIPILG